jgi:hypothetical protein
VSVTQFNNHNYDDDDLLWGPRAIGAAIGMNASKAFRPVAIQLPESRFPHSWHQFPHPALAINHECLWP